MQGGIRNLVGGESAVIYFIQIQCSIEGITPAFLFQTAEAEFVIFFRVLKLVGSGLVPDGNPVLSPIGYLQNKPIFQRLKDRAEMFSVCKGIVVVPVQTAVKSS